MWEGKSIVNGRRLFHFKRLSTAHLKLSTACSTPLLPGSGLSNSLKLYERVTLNQISVVVVVVVVVVF